MLLRRISEHVKTQNWTAVALDFVIVVAGVFMGIQVSNWNDARQTRAVETATHRALREDFEVIRTNLNAYAESNLSQARFMAIVVDALEEGVVPDAEEENFRWGLKSMMFTIPPPQTSGTLEGILTSGGLATVSDPELRRRLFEFQSHLERLEAQTAEFADVLMVYKNRTKLSMTYAIEGADVIDSLTQSDSDIDAIGQRFYSSVVAYDLDALRADPQVHQSFVEAYDVRLISAHWAIGLRESTDAVIERLNEIEG